MGTAAHDDSGQPADVELAAALQMFVHQLRTPLSAAMGYLRLVQGGQLPDAETHAKAVEGSLRGLRQMGNLCDEASAFVDADSSVQVIRYPATELLDALRRLGPAKGVSVEMPAPAIADGSVRTLPHDQAADAVLTLLRHNSAPGTDVRIAFAVEDNALRLSTAEIPVPAGTNPVPAEMTFDPWRPARGFAFALAAKRLVAGGAGIRPTGGVSGRITITFRLEFGE